MRKDDLPLTIVPIPSGRETEAHCTHGAIRTAACLMKSFAISFTSYTFILNLNHSSQPNCETTVDQGNVYVSALFDIPKG